jgi:hypothetical protein
MTELTLTRTDDQRVVVAACEHGTTSLSEAELKGDWTDAEILEQAVAYHAVAYRECDCSFDQGDDARPVEGLPVETARPPILPGLAVSLAAWRIAHGFATPTDERLIEWFRRERDSTDETR